MNNKYIVGIRCKETGVISAMSVVDDVAKWRDDVRASLASTPACAYAMYPDNYDMVSQSVGADWNLAAELKHGKADNV